MRQMRFGCELFLPSPGDRFPHFQKTGFKRIFDSEQEVSFHTTCCRGHPWFCLHLHLIWTNDILTPAHSACAGSALSTAARWISAAQPPHRAQCGSSPRSQWCAASWRCSGCRAPLTSVRQHSSLGSRFHAGIKMRPDSWRARPGLGRSMFFLRGCQGRAAA